MFGENTMDNKVKLPLPKFTPAKVQAMLQWMRDALKAKENILAKLDEQIRWGTVGKKVIDSNRKKGRKPASDTVPGVLLQMNDCLTAKPHILARKIQKMGGRFAIMDLKNIETQIRHFRARVKKADSKP
jgi:hypothetical protein